MNASELDRRFDAEENISNEVKWDEAGGPNLAIANQLTSGPAHSFADWPNVAVPTFGAGVYTIWHKDESFLYVGMSGRGITAETSRRNKPHGIYTRLHSHASGRRSGDQFCVYVADRFVLPALSHEDVAAIASGRHQMDAYVRRYIHENLCYRFVMLPDGGAAYAVEAAIKRGQWGIGQPFLNPGKGTDPKAKLAGGNA